MYNHFAHSLFLRSYNRQRNMIHSGRRHIYITNCIFIRLKLWSCVFILLKKLARPIRNRVRIGFFKNKRSTDVEYDFFGFVILVSSWRYHSELVRQRRIDNLNLIRILLELLPQRSGIVDDLEQRYIYFLHIQKDIILDDIYLLNNLLLRASVKNSSCYIFEVQLLSALSFDCFCELEVSDQLDNTAVSLKPNDEMIFHVIQVHLIRLLPNFY